MAFKTALLFVAVSGSTTSQIAGAPFDMVRIPTTTLTLGTDMDGLMTAAEACSRRNKRDKIVGGCAPEDYAIELSSGPPVSVRSFFFDRREVSLGDYRRCVRAGRCTPLPRERLTTHFEGQNLPAVFVTYQGASAYCHFRGARLPTEAEFEAAARGKHGRPYPWGEVYHRGRANSGRGGTSATDVRDGFELLAPSDSYQDGRSPQGVQNLSGNAAEWTATRFGPHSSKEGDRPSGYRVVKGGSFADDPMALRATARQKRQIGLESAEVGFRCALDAQPPTNGQRPH